MNAYVKARTYPDETGQWWHDTYDPDGTVTSHTATTEPPAPVEPPPPAPTALDRLATLPAAQADAVIGLSLGLIDKAGDLYGALIKMSASNTARPAIDLITDAVLTAALPLLAEDTP